MDTAEFFAKVTPSAGKKVLAVLNSGSKFFWDHTAFDSVEAMAKAATTSKARAVYFAVNGFGDWYEQEVNERIVRRIRTQENVVACRSLYDDIDIGKPGAYATVREALEAVIAAVGSGLPQPMIVSSGGGLHLYWPMTHDISPDQWQVMAAMKRTITTHLALLVDHAVDEDSARVLRPIGTFNNKGDTPRPVVLVRDVAAYDPAGLERRLRELHGICGGDATDLRMAPAFLMGFKVESDLAVAREYPPSSAMQIVEKCAALSNIVENQAAVQEPQWRAMLGLVKFTVEGRALAHQWSSQHPSYSAADTDEKYDRWGAAPATCAEFGKYDKACEACQFKGKIKSPIALGYTAELPAAPPEVVTQASQANSLFDADPEDDQATGHREVFMPKNFAVVNNELCRYTKDANDLPHWLPFASVTFIPQQRIRDGDGAWCIECVRAYQGRDPYTFNIPTKVINSPEGLGTCLAENEIALQGRNGKLYAMEYVQHYLNHLHDVNRKVETYNHFGWTEDYSGFLVGNQMITADGVTEVLVSEDIQNSQLRGDLGMRGTAKAWTEAVDQVYNRPGAEAMQFVICAAFASPLVKLLESDSWHGIPIALTGGSGGGKSTVCKVACSVFGAPAALALSTSKAGANMTPLYTLSATACNIPLLFDELSGREPGELSDMMYALSNGRPKLRGTPTGGVQKFTGGWDVIHFISSNNNIMEKLYEFRSDTAEATALRCFEVPLGDNYVRQHFSDVDRALIEETLLKKNYGKVGREYLRYLIQNRETVQQLLTKARYNLQTNPRYQGRDRFYLDLISTVIVGAAIAKKVGLINFDINRVREWALLQVDKMHDQQSDMRAGPAEMFARMVSDLNGRIIESQHFNDGRSVVETTVAPRLPPAARICTKARIAFISVKWFMAWCQDQGLSPRQMRNNLTADGVIISDGRVAPKTSLGRGTNVPSAQEAVMQINYASIMPIVERNEDRNVVNFPAAAGK